MQNVERSLGPLETIIDKKLERSFFEGPKRVLADEAFADSSTAERKVRQQVEQRRKERNQKKVQNWWERLMRRRHMSDDDSPRQGLESNALRSVTVCPRCKAVYRSGVMECHDTMSGLVMECHEEGL